MTKPNTFIIGAPKCGTTALATYLSEHPNVFMSSPKEPHFFLIDSLPNRTKYSSLDHYLELFHGTTEEHKTIAEASVWYMFNYFAVEKILCFDPGSRFIVMLRRPDEMLHAMHSQNLASLQEDIESFEEAWGLSLKTNVRDRYPPLCRAPEFLQYDKIAKFGAQVERLKKIIPSNQLHIIFFDDFSTNTANVYNELLSFLNLSDDKRASFEIINPNKELRNRFLGAILKSPPKSVLKFTKTLKSAFGMEKIEIREKLNQMNSKKKRRNILPARLRREIIEHHREDIVLLSKITNRDLAHWLEV